MERIELTDEIKLFVTQALACFDTPSTVAKAVKDDFGLDVSRQAVERYDPTKRAGQDLSAELKAVFKATRAAFLTDTAEIGISHRSVRLRTLQRMALKAEEMRNLPLAAQLLEQAAKECGNAYTNRREVTGADGKPIQAEVAARPDLSGLDQKARDALRTVAEQLAGRPAGSASGA